MVKNKIIIAGIGGVGGYFGGLLAKYFYDNDDVGIGFVARGEHLRAIRANGLKVIVGNNEFIARPKWITDDPNDIRKADLIIISTKSYDLEAVIGQLRPCIDSGTLILPLLNGVDSREKIQDMLPANTVLDGCVYIISRLKQSGVIENSGNIQDLYFGIDNFLDDRLSLFKDLFKEAGINAFLSETISTIIWEKFIFISPTATATSYFDKCIGEILANGESLRALTALIEEVRQVAMAKGIRVPENIKEITLNKLKALPFETTSSMHSDFKGNKEKNELESLTAYVLTEGQRYGLEMPTYLKTYGQLKNRSGAY